MTGVPSDIPQATMIAANNGQPLQWPGDEIANALYACFLLDGVERIVGHEVATDAFMMGSFGDAETDQRMQQALKTISEHNTRHPEHPRGARGLLERWRQG